MPGGVIEEYGCVLLPAGALKVELPGQVAKEGGHDVGVRVGLGH